MQEELLCRILQRHAAVVIDGKQAPVGIGEPGKGLFQERVRDGGREACEQQVQIERVEIVDGISALRVPDSQSGFFIRAVLRGELVR